VLIELTVAAPISFLEFDRSSDVEVSQTDKGDENGEDELKEVPEPDDVVRIHAKLRCFDNVFSHVGLQSLK
jgi:hypothetical protein